MQAARTLFVCSLPEMPVHVRACAPSHLVSIVRSDEQPPTPAGIARDHHLRISVDDICAPADGYVCPSREHIEQLIGFVAAWQGDAPLLLHCYAGISRSMAAALIALGIDGRRAESKLAGYLRQAAPHALPNRRMIDLADAVLGRSGRLIEACAAMGPAEPMLRGPLVRLTLPHAG